MARTYHFQFVEEALQEVQDSYDWYEGRITGLGEQFLQELEKCLDRIDATRRCIPLLTGTNEKDNWTVFLLS